MRHFGTAVALIVGAVVSGPHLTADIVWLLAPIHAQKVPGAFGSIWSTELRVFNAGESSATLAPPCFTGGPCPKNEIGARSDVEVIPILFPGEGEPVFYAADSSEIGRLTFQLRVFDESRSMLNWGTTIPVVEWEKVRGDRFWFVRVPASAPFRHTLRIYAFYQNPTIARARYFNADTGEPVTERAVLVNPQSFGNVLLDSRSIPELEGVSSVRIEVSVESGDAIWAMVSVTNDDTQVVTILPGEQRAGD